MSEVVSWNWISFEYVCTSNIATAFINTHYKQSQVSTIEGLEADDRAWVARLLEKVKKTCEKDFVHGWCLKPVTLVYYGEDHDDTSKTIGKTATFVSLPIFWLDSLPQDSLEQDSPSHPSRALLQTRCRLESTRRRDKEQVITKFGSVQSVIHLP